MSTIEPTVGRAITPGEGNVENVGDSSSPHILSQGHNAQAMQSVTTESPLDRLQRLLPDLFEPRQQTGELFLKFQLDTTLQAAISLERVVETLQIPAASVTPIPNMPVSTLGLMSTKGRVFWAVDLVKLLEMPSPLRRSRRYEVIIVRALPVNNMARPSGIDTEEELLLGLVVSHIRGTLRLNPDDVASPEEEVFPELIPFLQGQVGQGDEKIMVLSVEAISNARGLISRPT